MRTPTIFLVVLLVLSFGLNAVQLRNSAARQDQWNESLVLESLLRLGANRTILADPKNSLSTQSLQHLHGQILMDMIRVQPALDDLSDAHQQRYEKILADLNRMKLVRPDLIDRESTLMDDDMYERYVSMISDGSDRD